MRPVGRSPAQRSPLGCSPALCTPLRRALGSGPAFSGTPAVQSTANLTRESVHRLLQTALRPFGLRLRALSVRLQTPRAFSSRVFCGRPRRVRTAAKRSAVRCCFGGKKSAVGIDPATFSFRVLSLDHSISRAVANNPFVYPSFDVSCGRAHAVVRSGVHPRSLACPHRSARRVLGARVAVCRMPSAPGAAGRWLAAGGSFCAACRSFRST